ncbi:hypothetical protein CJF39_01775, partial [Pseudomonas lundensis]
HHLVINAAGIFCSTPIQLGGVPIPGTPALPLAPGEVKGLQSVELDPATQLQALYLKAPACPQCEIFKKPLSVGGAHADA